MAKRAKEANLGSISKNTCFTELVFTPQYFRGGNWLWYRFERETHGERLSVHITFLVNFDHSKGNWEFFGSNLQQTSYPTSTTVFMKRLMEENSLNICKIVLTTLLVASGLLLTLVPKLSVWK